MCVRVFFDPIFCRLTGTEEAELVIDGTDLGGLVAALADRFGGGIREALVDAHGGMAPGVVALADGKRLNLDSPIAEGVEVAFLKAIVGG
ncbi:MAG: MoaD/ThiS family protein [Chloroflexi bacterium]|nr:MoaD/ThiS family protein [Chloroflexota bacterium]